MSPYDRKIVLKTLTKIKEQEAEASEKASNPRMRRSASRY